MTLWSLLVLRWSLLPVDAVPSSEDPPLCRGDVEETDNDPLSTATASVSSDEPGVVLPAMLVGDEELGDLDRDEPSNIPKAKEIDPFQLSSTVILRRRLFLTIAAAAVLVVVGAILDVTLRKQQPNDADQMLSFADFRGSYLPTETLQQAVEDPKSPQGQALAWIEQDAQDNPRVAWRMLQRYALAVVYFSLQTTDRLNGTKDMSARGIHSLIRHPTPMIMNPLATRAIGTSVLPWLTGT
jgi:hypothetical protein